MRNSVPTFIINVEIMNIFIPELNGQRQGRNLRLGLKISITRSLTPNSVITGMSHKAWLTQGPSAEI